MTFRDLQAIVQIATEGAHAHRVLEVAVRGSDQANIGFERVFATHSLEGAVLENPQQEELRGGRDLTDLVEEERTALGDLESSALETRRPGECASLVTE